MEGRSERGDQRDLIWFSCQCASSALQDCTRLRGMMCEQGWEGVTGRSACGMSRKPQRRESHWSRKGIRDSLAQGSRSIHIAVLDTS